MRSEVEGSRPKDIGRSRRVALVGETIEQVREVMVFGESGILACSPPDRRPEWQATRKRLVWPNGAVAQVFSAHDPESLRGPQFDAAWVDELAKWKKGQEAWDMLQFGLRLGDCPRQCVTTTLKNARVLLRVPDGKRQAVMQQMLERASFADLYYKRLGHGHPEWGNGSLMAVAFGRDMAPEPFLDDTDYCSCFVLVFEALIQWRSERALLNRPRKTHRLPRLDQAAGA